MALPRGFGTTAGRLTRQSRFVFTGSLERLAGSTLSLLPAGPRTAVVRVDPIHRAAHELHDQGGQSITVVLADEVDGDRERRLVFFTDPILFGETMAVREIGRLPVPDDLSALNELMDRVEVEMVEEVLREHLRAADAVIYGRVLTIRRVSSATAATAGEHDPDWWAAVIRVIRSVKGEQGNDVEVRYPNSDDIAWYRVPKLREGAEGVFFLHRAGTEDGGIALAIIHPEDFVPGGEEEATRIGGYL